MKRTFRRLIGLLLIGILINSAAYLTSCASRTVVIPEDRMIKSLPNGNYEVTPAWLQDRYKYELWLRRQLDECKGGE